MADRKTRIIKVVYFDEEAATDYITIKNGGQIDWSTTENKEKLAKIMAEIEAQTKGGVNFLSVLKASFSGKVAATADAETSKLFESTMKNTILTDYIALASEDKSVKQFDNDGVYAPENSVSMYRMYSSYLNIVPKDQMPIDIGQLNNAILGERGYYQMLLNSETEPTCVLRFNIKAFRNNYCLADLSKMNLSYFGVKVGKCTKRQLLLEGEFETPTTKKPLRPEEIVSGDAIQTEKQLDVYDIVLAGVMVCE